MNKLIVVVSAMAALSLLVPHAGFAQHEFSPNNIVGLYLEPDGTGANGTFDIGVPISVYLVLINPTDVENDDAPYATINAFECTLNFYGPALFLVDETLPPTAANDGDAGDINNGFLEYIVGLDTPLEVTAGSATLVSFQFMSTNPGVTEITLAPTSAPGIPGAMAYQSVAGEFRTMYPANGSFDFPLFCFNAYCGPSPAEDKCFGSVKALYR